MYRELVSQSAKLSLTGKGMVYNLLFIVSSTTYLYFFDMQVVFISMILLSFIAVVTSILSDKKTLGQYVSVLILSGARRKLILICIRVYLLIRLAPILLAYTIYLIYFSRYIVTIIVTIIYVMYMLFLSYVLYKVLKR